jgi:hypothetical protein
MDINSDWCFYRNGHDDLRLVIDGLRPFESMTWGEIEGSRSHFISRSSIIAAAQKRLREIKQDDVDELFSLRLTGRQRIFGIRDGAILRLLWWDPLHELCPSRPR